MLKFTGTEGLIFFNKILVISDLHIGIERELYREGNKYSFSSKLLYK
jgi:hypothetical protein